MKTNKYKVNKSSRKKSLQDGNPSYGDSIVEIGLLFINAPYKAGTLEITKKEKLIVNVSAFDCTTFVEAVIALARCASAGKILRNEFRRNLQLIRYRRGKINGYSSRLHYFTDWLRDNEKKKILINVSRRLGGKPQCKKINFMTYNRKLYVALNNKTQFAKMLAAEKNLSRKTFYIIEKDKLNTQKAIIQNGDIIAFTTNQEGLDVAHSGFAIWYRKNLHLLHASKKEGAVVISQKTLTAFLKSNKKFTGIIVARPL
ncbi:MAG: DUF1460 domain-containing protein [Deltaproteobacteria bacterium]|nr:DUF1460 domain-containing protein [Deltaproteobacteria bacterium]